MDAGTFNRSVRMVQERAASLDRCPWCASKGLSSALRSYRLNVHESITLCSEPQCLFPLVSRPLEDVLASLVPAETAAGGGKRKTLPQSDEDDRNAVKVKRLRSDQHDADAGTAVVNSHCDATMTRAQRSGGKSCPPQDGVSNQSGCPASSVAPQIDDGVVYSDLLGNAPDEIVSSPNRPASESEKPVDAPEETFASPVAAPGKPIDVPVAALEEPARLFWKNAHNLCWLDVLLVFLVNCRSLRKVKPRREPQRGAIWRLLSGYDDAREALRAGSGDKKRAQREADERLQELRTAAFELLRPQLRCKLGQKESPVFAMPLLLAADSWAEPLFRTAFRWELTCAKCETVATERVTKTLPTFTNVLPDWHPTRAVHLAPCNACGAQRQHRRMTLERVAPVLVLHFVEGLAHGDVDALAFTWEGRRHAVTALVQYQRRDEHFVAWTRTPDGSWLEFNDLKHPESGLHRTLPVPAGEIHLLFWEAEKDSPGSGAHSPSSASPDSSSFHRVASEASEDSLLFLALGEENAVTTEAPEDVSIGSTTLLETFHGLSHDDIITLTLMEVQSDVPTGHKELPDCVAAPDSSSLTPGDPEEPPPSSAGSDVNDADDDPNLEQGPKRSKSVSAVGETAGTKAPPQEVGAQDIRPPPQRVQWASPVASAGPSPSPLDPKSRWSYMFSQLPVSQRPPGPVSQINTPPSYSTPVPAKRPPAPAPLLPEPEPLRTDDGDGLPLKSAERFCAFGTAVQIPTPLPRSDRGDVSAGSSAPPAFLSDTDALRRKLLKKLKAKKKKLAKLNQLLAGNTPVSPVSVSSSSTCDSFLPRDPPLPSPDSSGFLDALAGLRDGTCAAQQQQQQPPQMENFLDEFLSTAAPTEAQRVMEKEALQELELFLL